MNSPHLSWQNLKHVELLPTLLRLRRGEVVGNSQSPLGLRSDLKIRLGIPDLFSERSIPIVVIEDKYVNELFAWLYTYAEDAMPLSIYCKVLKSSDYSDIELIPPSLLPSDFRRWASIVVGEMMFRSGTGAVISDAAAAWALRSYSFCAALAYAAYGQSTPSLLGIFLQRMKALASTEGAHPEDLSILEQIWQICHRSEKFSHSPREAIVFCFRLLVSNSPEVHKILDANSQLRKLVFEIIDGGDLHSESMEQRVRFFDKYSASMYLADKGQTLLGGFGIAAAAFLVGKDTSYIHLLEGQENKTVYLWIALFSGLCGDESWDSKWLQLTRKIEALADFHYNSNLFSRTLTDLSWTEYDWISQTKDYVKQLKFIPRNSSGFIMIEVLPGVPFQLRFPRSEQGEPHALSQTYFESERNYAMAKTLEEFAKELRNRSSSISASHAFPAQSELGFDDTSVAKRRQRRKRFF